MQLAGEDPAIAEILAFIARQASRFAFRPTTASIDDGMAAAMISAASDISSPVGVIAGGGAMPFAVAESLSQRGSRRCCSRCAAPVILIVERFRHHWISVGQLGRATKLFRSEGCRDLIFIGTLLRPALSEIRLDWGTIRVLGRVWPRFAAATITCCRGSAASSNRTLSGWSASGMSPPIF